MFGTIIKFLILILLVFVLVYYIKNYRNLKKSMDESCETSAIDLTNERPERLAELKNVVNQMNTINNDMYTTLQTTDEEDLAKKLIKKEADFTKTMNSTFRFKDTSGKVIPLTELPGFKNADMQLLNNVYSTMEMTANNLEVRGNTRINSKLGPSSSPSGQRSINLPDKDGNIRIKDIGNKPGHITLDATNGTKITNDLTINGPLNMTSRFGTLSGVINQTQSANKLLINNKSLGICNHTSTKPKASLFVISPNNTDDLVKLTSDNETVLAVNPNGAINMYSNSLKCGNINSIQSGLKFTTPRLNISGNLFIKGSLNYTGRLKALST